jgi:hypothetical protein
MSVTCFERWLCRHWRPSDREKEGAAFLCFARWRSLPALLSGPRVSRLRDLGDAPPSRQRFISSSATRPVALMLVVRMWQFGSEREVETTRINDG